MVRELCQFVRHSVGYIDTVRGEGRGGRGRGVVGGVWEGRTGAWSGGESVGGEDGSMEWWGKCGRGET